MFLIPLIIFSLFLDTYLSFAGQMLLGFMWWGIFLQIVLSRHHPLQQVRLWTCLIIATLGELVLSLGFEFYQYRLNNIPFFVPPGHVALFIIGMICAPRLPRWIIWVVPLVTVPWLLLLLQIGADQLSLVFFGLFVLCLWLGKAKKLYATMFIFAAVLEIFGTAWGCWTWQLDTTIGLSSANPPLCVGALYCVLDALTSKVVKIVRQRYYSPVLQLSPTPA